MPSIRDLHLFFFVFCLFDCLFRQILILAWNIFDKQYDKKHKKLLWKLLILWISQNVLAVLSMLKALDSRERSKPEKFYKKLK